MIAALVKLEIEAKTPVIVSCAVAIVLYILLDLSLARVLVNL